MIDIPNKHHIKRSERRPLNPLTPAVAMGTAKKHPVPDRVVVICNL